MTFDQDVRDYLEEVERKPPAQERSRHRRIDEGELHKSFLARLREREQIEPPGVIEILFRDWSPKLARFVRHLEALPPHEAPIGDEAALGFARRALDEAIGHRDASVGLVDGLELARIVHDFDAPRVIETYALENRLVRREPSQSAEVTDLGRAFLRLRGEDAVRWLLTIEVAQSRGAWDPWRVSRELLEQVSSDRGLVQSVTPEGEPFFPFDLATLQRLVRFEVVREYADERDEIYLYRINAPMRAVVQRVLEVGPWHTAVAALLEDERADVLPVPRPRATEVAIEQTRMIAHEVRNALIPVRHHVDTLLKASDAGSRARLESSRRGVVRVLAFVDEMVATSEILNEPLTSFDVGDVVRGALGWLEGGERVELNLLAGSTKLRGRRSRLQRAISNVVLNALQATNAEQRVRVRTGRVAGMVEINVDDGGPGVPEESRTIVFDDGFTTRGGAGGSGFGLAYVRRVVEELEGKVWCETSDLGGARFVMALPESENDR